LIFHYFGDKEGLYRSIVTRLKLRLHTEYLVPLMAFIDSSEAMDASRVRFFLELAVEQYLAFLTEHARNLRMMAWEAAEGWHTFMVGPIKEEERQKFSVTCVVDFLRQAQQTGIIHSDLDPRFLMINIANMCMMYLLTLPRFQWLFDQPMDDHTYIRRQIVQFILHGILVSPIEGTQA
jgi:TetR/AcrR family transcriptional regulator